MCLTLEKGNTSYNQAYISFLFRPRNNIRSFLFQVVDIRVSGIRRCHRRDEFSSYPLPMADGSPIACSPTWAASVPILSYPRNIYIHTRVRTHHVCARQRMRRYKRSRVPFPLMSDVAILADPSRRYSEIYGDATVGTWDCDQVWRVREEVRRGWREREERPEDEESISCAKEANAHVCEYTYKR